MLNIIKDNAVVANDPWDVVDKETTIGDIASLNYAILPLALWQAHRSELLGREDIGVWLDADEPAHLINDDIISLTLIAINFPVFSDGRGYSYAQNIRRDGYKGELRAIGDVLKDQLFFYKRVGFNAFALRQDLNPHEAIDHLNDFADGYQVSHSHPIPLFKRR